MLALSLLLFFLAVSSASTESIDTYQRSEVLSRYVEWTEVRTLRCNPSPRMGHSAVVRENTTMILFGGFDGTRYLAEFLLFNLEARRWVSLVAIGDTPEGRFRHSSVLTMDQTEMIVFGGCKRSVITEELWIYNFDEKTWRSSQVRRGPRPSARESHAAVTTERGMIVFGGFDGSFLSDMLLYNYVNDEWTGVHQLGYVPSARSGHSMSVMQLPSTPTQPAKEERLLLLGGYNHGRSLSDFYKGSLKQDERTGGLSVFWQHATPAISSSLTDHCALLFPTHNYLSLLEEQEEEPFYALYVFGGRPASTGDNSAGEVTVLFPRGSLWTPTTRGKDAPKSRIEHSCIRTEKNELVIFGGYTPSGRLLQDCWLLRTLCSPALTSDKSCHCTSSSPSSQEEVVIRCDTNALILSSSADIGAATILSNADVILNSSSTLTSDVIVENEGSTVALYGRFKVMGRIHFVGTWSLRFSSFITANVSLQLAEVSDQSPLHSFNGSAPSVPRFSIECWNITDIGIPPQCSLMQARPVMTPCTAPSEDSTTTAQLARSQCLLWTGWVEIQTTLSQEGSIPSSHGSSLGVILRSLLYLIARFVLF